MGGKGSRDKGKRGEYEARDFFRQWWPLAERGANQSRSGSEAGDIEGVPFWVESKLGAKPNVRAALAQAKKATDGRPVICRIRDDREDAFYVMPEATMHMLLNCYCSATWAAEWVAPVKVALP